MSSSRSTPLLDYADFSKIEKQLQQRRGQASKQGYETWRWYDSSLREVMRRHGKSVGRDNGGDFYHGGDWFHELYDGFALRTTSSLSPELLQALQEVVAQHHPDAVVDLGGDTNTVIEGLRVLVTSTAIHVAWFEGSAESCERKLNEAGVQLC